MRPDDQPGGGTPLIPPSLTQRLEGHSRALDKIQETTAQIQVALARIEATCGPCRAKVEAIDVLLQGPPDNGQRPGLKGRVESLEQSRRLTRWGLRAAWGVITGLVLTVIGALLKSTGG